eukprot:CAMPEP_0170635762 /NCGR_PEP_ID=MMETSP0224-20130122/37405_1 /TAXON_ID=285029 /ORGANISM="Togula jolla, Strain CCCM 725" /LENGTH=82 /DNA_ID=CAMNT_0010965305 /DNA_START=1278 /DNA_END=1522 /DNA_ORIENTATION=-
MDYPSGRISGSYEVQVSAADYPVCLFNSPKGLSEHNHIDEPKSNRTQYHMQAGSCPVKATLPGCPDREGLQTSKEGLSTTWR